MLKIPIAIITSIVGSFVVPAFAGGQTNNKIGVYDDRPFICGAVYRILVEAHSGDKDKEIYKYYKSRFDRLYEQAKANIKNAGGNDDDAKLAMQDNIDFIGRMLNKKRSEPRDHLLFCERFWRTQYPIEKQEPR